MDLQHAYSVHASFHRQECRLTVGSPSTSERLPDLGGLKPYLCLTFIFCFRIASKAISMASLLLPWALNSCRGPQICFMQSAVQHASVQMIVRCMIVRCKMTAKTQDVNTRLVMKFVSDVFADLIQVISCILNLLKCSCMLHTQQPA